MGEGGGGVKCCPACDWRCELVFFVVAAFVFELRSFELRLAPRYIKAEGACMHTHKDFCCSYFIFRNIGRRLCSFSRHCEHVSYPGSLQGCIWFFADGNSC